MITEPDEIERSIIEEVNRIAKRHHTAPSDKHALTQELTTALSELGDRHGFDTAKTPGCADLERLYDLVWMKNSLGELVDVPLLATVDLSSNFQVVEEAFYKLVIARSQHRLMIFDGINEQTIQGRVERLGRMVRSFAGSRRGDRYLFLGFCEADRDVKAEVWAAD
jgi:hypothetical protein